MSSIKYIYIIFLSKKRIYDISFLINDIFPNKKYSMISVFILKKEDGDKITGAKISHKKERKMLVPDNKNYWIVSGIGDPLEYVPDNTSLCCWHCTRFFDRSPIAIPYYKNKNTYLLQGCFCSFQCALAWNDNHKSVDNEQQDRELLLRELFEECGGKGKLFPAPDKENLYKFGGMMSDKDFDDAIDNKIKIKMGVSVQYVPVTFNIKSSENIREQLSGVLINTYKLFRKSKLPEL